MLVGMLNATTFVPIITLQSKAVCLRLGNTVDKMLLLVILASATVVLFLQPIVSFFRDAKHLHKFPAPSYAGISSLWRILKNLQCEHFLAVHEAH
jgi:hypothetical protein